MINSSKTWSHLHEKSWNECMFDDRDRELGWLDDLKKKENITFDILVFSTGKRDALFRSGDYTWGGP